MGERTFRKASRKQRNPSRDLFKGDEVVAPFHQGR
jgi:hypothetical protein